jgi:hypothetical protein
VSFVERALAITALAALAGGCRCEGIQDVKSIDRSDGKLPELQVPQVAKGVITIDGRLDEAAWSAAGRSSAFVAPGSGKLVPGSKVAASARLLWSAEALYLAITVADRKPTSPFTRETIDPHIWARASGVELMLQPGDPGNNRHYYELQVDIKGAVWDTRFDDYNRPITGRGATRRYGHQSWQAKLRRAVRVERGKRYTIELALPFASLSSPQAKSPPAIGDRWRANIYSFRDGQRHALAWSPTLRRGNFHKASRFGRLIFGGPTKAAARPKGTAQGSTPAR